MKLPTLYKRDSKGKIRTISIEIDGSKYRTISGIEHGKLITNKWTKTIPKNIGKLNYVTAEEQAKKEAKSKWNKKLNEHYFELRVDALLIQDQFFKVMLATDSSKVDMDKIWLTNEYLLVDAKLDGMRLVERLKDVHSRTGKPVVTAQWVSEDLKPFFKKHPTIILDGELYNHDYKDDFQELMSIAKRSSLNADTKQRAKTLLQYHIYDMFDEDVPNMTAQERKDFIDKYITPSSRIKLVTPIAVYNNIQLQLAIEANLAAGYEGSIIRLPNSTYKNGRSKDLLKVKDFITEEFTVIEILPGIGNRGDIAGRLVVDVNGINVYCSIRGSWDYCKTLLNNYTDYIGGIATIRYFSKTKDGSLRFPVCIELNRWKHE